MRFALPAILAVTLLAPAAAVAQPTRQVPVDSLIYDLRNPDPVRRREAVVLIGQNKVQRAVPDVVAIAGDPDASVRRAIVATLQALDDIRSLPGLVALTSDPEKDIRESAVTGVTRLYLPRESGIGPSLTRVVNFFNPNADEWADVVIEPDLAVDPTVVPALQARLQDPSDSIRIKAARSLGILRGRAAVPMLVLVMKEDRNTSVRFEAIRALGKIGDTAAAKDVLPFTLSTESKLRTEAALTVGRLHDRAALPELTRLFMKEAALQKRQADAPFRAALMEAIALIADPSSKELFTRQRAHDDAAVRVHAYAGLARVGDASLTTAVSQERLSETDAAGADRPGVRALPLRPQGIPGGSGQGARVAPDVGPRPRVPARAAPGRGRRPRRAVAARGRRAARVDRRDPRPHRRRPGPPGAAGADPRHARPGRPAGHPGARADRRAQRRQQRAAAAVGPLATASAAPVAPA